MAAAAKSRKRLIIDSDSDGNGENYSKNGAKSSTTKRISKSNFPPRKETTVSIENGHQKSGVSKEEIDNFTPLFEKKMTLDDFIEIEASKYFAYGRNILPPTPGIKKGKKKKGDVKKSVPKVPRFSFDSLRECFEKGDGLLAKKMEKKHKDQFSRWMLYLSEGANVLLRGFGSKLNLLEQFRHRQLVENGYTHVVLHGYRPDASVKQLLNTLKTNFDLDITPEKTKNGGLVQNARQICDALRDDPDASDFIIIIHNIDGLSLRDIESQTALSYLAESKRCRILASVDHVNANLLWDRSRSNRFCWLSIDATTYVNYRTEIVDGHGSKILGLTKNTNANGSSHSLNGLKSIWSSLTKNAKCTFVKLAECQLKKRKGGGRFGNLMTFWNLFDEGQKDFFISSEVQLKQILTEFHDHNLVKKKLNDENQDVFQVDVDNDLLIEFLESEGIKIDGVVSASAIGNSEGKNEENEISAIGKDDDLTSDEEGENGIIDSESDTFSEDDASTDDESSDDSVSVTY